MESKESRDEELAYEAKIEAYEEAMREREELAARVGEYVRRLRKPPRDNAAAVESNSWWKPEFLPRISPRHDLADEER